MNGGIYPKRACQTVSSDGQTQTLGLDKSVFFFAFFAFFCG
jgi:hypothetical protein